MKQSTMIIVGVGIAAVVLVGGFLLMNMQKSNQSMSKTAETNTSTTAVTEEKTMNNKYYTPENCVISVCSSLTFEEIHINIEKCFKAWNKKFYGIERNS